MKNDNWIQGVTKEMEKRGTVGAFTKQAKDAGMGVHDFAMKVKDNPEDYTKKTRARATFALNMENIAKKRKMAKGGTTQGYNDKLDEDLGNRLGREKGYKQSLKDRRDESKAGNKTQGRRAYSSVGTMDGNDWEKGWKMARGGKLPALEKRLKTKSISEIIEYLDFENSSGAEEWMDENGKIRDKAKLERYLNEAFMEPNDYLEQHFEDVDDPENYAKGGKTQGYDDKQNESLGMRTGKQSSKTQSSKARRDDSYGKWGKRSKEDRKVTMAHGGKTQGYDDKLNESLGMRTGKSTSKLQTKKDRRDESKGMEKSSGKRVYSKVGTMDKKMARGGAVEGKIDRDRYVKLQRDNKKVVEKLKKEKGVLRKDFKEAEEKLKKEKGVLRKDFKEVEEKLKKEKGVLSKKFTQAEVQAELSLDRVIECEETRVAPATGRDTNSNQTLLLGGIAGILFGAFLGSR